MGGTGATSQDSREVYRGPISGKCPHTKPSAFLPALASELQLGSFINSSSRSAAWALSPAREASHPLHFHLNHPGAHGSGAVALKWAPGTSSSTRELASSADAQAAHYRAVLTLWGV